LASDWRLGAPRKWSPAPLVLLPLLKLREVL